MSRESDNPMSPRQGGDSYPSGTPPYGVPGDAAFSRAGQPPQAGRPETPNRDEPRTETTLTTRIKINIPGSRPIPEVVVRSPLNEETGEQPAPRRRRADTSGSPVLGVMDSGARTATPPDLPPEWLTPEEPAPAPAEPTSEWFAPRKKGAPAAPAQPSQPSFQEPTAPQQQGAAPQAPAPGSTRPSPSGPGLDTPPPGYDMPYGSGRDAMPGPDAAGQSRPWTAPTPTQAGRPGQSGLSGQPSEQTRHGQPQQAQPQPTLPPRPVPGARAARLPGTGAPSADIPGAADTTGDPSTIQFRAPADLMTDRQAGFPPVGAGTAGVSGLAADAAMGTPTRPAPMPDSTTDQFGRPGPSGQSDPFGRPGQSDPFGPFSRPDRPGQPGPQPQPGQPAQPGQPDGNRRTKGGKTAKAAAGGAGGAGQKSAGQSPAARTAALPVPQPQSIGDGFAGGTGGVGAEPRPEPAGGGKGTGASTAPAGGGKAGSSKGRKLAGYAVGALVLAGAGAYGAGLMLNQADIPKGTTVLGYSIGGDTRDQAVTTLDHTLGAIASHPLTVSIGGKTTQLNPSVAGLTIDTGATVDSVDHHDYNPVTVIESLFGQGTAVAPVVSIDQDKLRSALQQLAQGSAVSDASVRFTAGGKAEVTLPKAGTGLDVDAAVPLVEQAFRARATGGEDQVVTLTVTTIQPKATAAAVQEAARTLGAWAMKQQFHVVAGNGRPVPFGKGTFSQALTLRPDASGAFVPVLNLAKLKAAYGTAFDGAHTKDGRPVTVQDVAAALVTLLSKPGGATTVSI